MKNLINLSLLLLCSMQAIAQVPQAFSYQAVARNADGTIIVNEEVQLDIEILKDAADGTSVYKESFTQNTSSTGVIAIFVGTGDVLSGDFQAIDWSTGTYFLKTYFNETEMGTTQILSVPFAMYADVAETVKTESQVLSLEGNVLSISGGNSVTLPIEATRQSILISGAVTNEEVATQLENELGPNTTVIEISGTTGLTNLEIIGKSGLFELVIGNNKDLETLSIEGMEQCGNIVISNNEELSDVSISGLEVCTSFLLSKSNISSLSLPGLKTVVEFLGFSNNKNAQSLLLPDLESVELILMLGNDVLDSVNVNSLKLLKELRVHTCSMLTYLNLDAVLTGFGLNSFQNGFQVDMVDYFLERLVSLPDAEVKEVTITAFYPGIPPSAEGMANVAILVSRGYTVYVDE